MMPRKVVTHRQQSGPALCRAWLYRDDGPLLYARCDTPLHLQVTSNRVIIACPWHPDRIYHVLPESAEAPIDDGPGDCWGAF